MLAKRQKVSGDSGELDDESESEYDDEMDDDGFIVNDEEAEQELINAKERERKLQKREMKKQRKQNKIKYQIEDIMDEDDYDLIRENANKKKKLKKVNDGEENDLGKDFGFKKSDKKKRGKGLSLLNDSDESYQEKDVSNQKFERRQGRKNQYDSTAEEEVERQNNLKRQEVIQKFLNDDFEEYLNNEKDIEIIKNDIPERLQLKLEGRFKPSPDELNVESDWIFNNIVDSNTILDLIKITETKSKIVKTLQMIRNKYYDLPYIKKYKLQDLQPELKEDDIQKIFNLDIEYAQFIQQKNQILKMLQNVLQFDSTIQEEIQTFIINLEFIKNSRELKDFQALEEFYKQYFQKEFDIYAKNNKDKKLPVQKQTFISLARERRLDEFSRRFTISPKEFTENILEDKLIYSKNTQNLRIKELVQEYQIDGRQELKTIIEDMCQYAALELECQPEIRKFFKKLVKEHGYFKTEPTEKGKRELDLFHPSYRVKKVTKLLSEITNDDIFLEIEQNLNLGLITFKIDLEDKESHFAKLFEKYQKQEQNNTESEKQFQKIRKQIQSHFCRNENLIIDGKSFKPFLQSIFDEIKAELREDAENFVLDQCRLTYQQLIQTPYFKRSEKKENLNVMGAIYHMIDQKNYMTTVVFIDKFGEVIANHNFLHLISPKRSKPKEDEQLVKRPGEDEEIQKYEEQKIHLQRLLCEHKVDLIVVAADSLEARRLKKSLTEISLLKSDFNDHERDESQQIEFQKDIPVIWGKIEVPKLFARSQSSQKLHQNLNFNLKKAISLARFQQDPMVEIINLWSPILNENQILNLNLHPLQKFVNKTRLMDILEEVNVQMINSVGIDINVLVNHKHMWNQLQFISGFGPRKAYDFINKLKQYKKALFSRKEIWKEILLEQDRCVLQCVGFLKIKVSSETKKTFSEDAHKISNLDQTRIHPNDYEFLYSIACYIQETNPNNLEDQQKEQLIIQLFKRPEKLKNGILSGDLLQKIEKNESNQKIIDFIQNKKTLDFIQNEICNPFKDPREDINQALEQKELLYCLIDDNERSFKVGIIVPATVIRVYQPSGTHAGRILCRLENGLEANINKEDADFFSQVEERSVITGRIHEIKFGTGDDMFSVNLKCRQQHLRSHEIYANNLFEIPQEDLINHNYQQTEEQVNIQKKNQILRRKINHPKFYNNSSTQVIDFLRREDNGEFYFRPSSRGQDHLTLTWKFYESNIVHIDIIEEEKPIGATIGQKLRIGEEVFENLQEIIERYLTPCNRSLRDATQHSKFFKGNKYEDLCEFLVQEKQNDVNQIPYRFIILDEYPQYIILAYVPKKEIIREFIKVKPRGFYFHQQYHFPFQSLINWFKQNFRIKDYLHHLKKVGSPQRIGLPVLSNKIVNVGMEIEVIPKQTKQSNEVKSILDELKEQNMSLGMVGSEHQQNQANSWGVKDQSEFRDREKQQTTGSKTCFNCQETGHFSRECPKEQQVRGRGRGGDRIGNNACFKCGEEGHMSRECTNPPKQGMGRGSGSNTCFNCNESGHMSRECTKPRAQRGRGRGRGDRVDQSTRRQENNGSDIWGDSKGFGGDAKDFSKANGGDPWGDSKGDATNFSKSNSGDPWGNSKGNGGDVTNFSKSKSEDPWGNSKNNQGNAWEDKNQNKADTWGSSNKQQNQKQDFVPQDSWGSSSKILKQDAQDPWGQQKQEDVLQQKPKSSNTWKQNEESNGGW